MHQEQKKQGVGAGGINPNAKTGGTAAFPALYEVESIGVDGAMEANGRVYHFCSERCRTAFEVFDVDYNPEVRSLQGYSSDWITGTVCHECAAPLSAINPPATISPVQITAIESVGQLKALLPPASAAATSTEPVAAYLARVEDAAIAQTGPACNVCEDGYKAIHNGICTNAACPFSVVGGNR